MTKTITEPPVTYTVHPCLCTREGGWLRVHLACVYHSGEREVEAWGQNSERKQSHLNRYYSGGR